MYKRELPIVPTVKVGADLVSDGPFSNEEFAVELVVGAVITEDLRLSIRPWQISVLERKRREVHIARDGVKDGDKDTACAAAPSGKLEMTGEVRAKRGMCPQLRAESTSLWR